MEDDNQDGPFTVWQMFNAPTMVLFNNLEHAADGLDRLLTSILKLSGDFSEVLVPRAGSSKYPDPYYHAFNTWLVGRLFYVWSVEELNRIHATSKDAQLKILNILCMNAASFYNNLHSEYVSILTKLVQYYKENPIDQSRGLLLENFKSEQIDIPNVQLNLEPIFVNVKDLRTCKTLIDLTMQLLAESLPTNSIYINKHKIEYCKLFNEILYMLEHYSVDIKLSSLKFFITLISNYEQIGICTFYQCFPSVYLDLLYSIEAILKSLNVFHEKGEIDAMYLDGFNKLMCTFMKIKGSPEKENEEILLNICTVILKTKSNKIFNNDLKLECLSLSKNLDLPKDLIDVSNMDTSEIDVLKETYCKNILEHIRSEVQGNSLIDLKGSWYFKQVLNVIKSIKSCEDNKIDIFLISYHLKRCLSCLCILEQVAIQCRKLQDKTKIEMLSKEDIHIIWGSLLKLIGNNKSVILGDSNCTRLFMDILLSTSVLYQTPSRDESNRILQLLCLQSSPQFSEHSLGYSDGIKSIILKYMMIIKLVLKVKTNDSWDRIISNLINGFIRNKSSNMFKEIIALCPLLMLNKVFSASKLIGDLLMPAFLTKDCDIQKDVTTVLPAICCMALGTYEIAISIPKDCYGHSLFSNNAVDVLLICSKCHSLDKNQYSKDFLNTVNQNKVEVFSESNTYTPSQHSTINSLKSLFAKFLNWKQYTDLENGGYWDLFARLCHHYYVLNYGVPADLLNEDNSEHVLKAFRRFIDDNSAEEDPEWNSHKDSAFSLCVNVLVQSTRASLENNDNTQQTNTLNLIKDFGLCSNEKVILPVTKLFVYFIMHPQCSLGPKAVVSLRDVCELHGYTPNQVYHRYKKDYCKLFVECSLYSGKDFAISLLKVVRAFGFVGYRDFISKDVHHFLPYLMPYSVTIKEVPSMIEEIASLVQCSVSDFLIERFPHIYVHVYLNESKEVEKKCLDIIGKLTKTSVLNLIKRHFRVILTEFLLQYCCDSDKVLNACRYLACHDPDVSTPTGSMSMSTSQIADFLNPKFLGVLAYFDHKLVNAKVALSVKRKALKSFPDIMQLMGVKYLTPLRFKVLATLRSALQLAKEFPKILAEAWGAFIHNIDTISLGPLLSNLAVSLLQQLDYAPQEINKIFQYLVLNNENLLSSHISDLFFLEDTKISDKIKLVIKRHVKRTQPDGFLDKIKWYLQHLNHDIPSIKAYAFSHLDKLLKSNRSEIHKAIFGGKNIDPVIVELIDYLLLGCKDPDSKVSLSSGSCLGQLGAIEAGHLPRQYVQPDRSPFAFSIGDDCFAATALVELSRAFQYEKDTMNMDCYALTIQEILKIYDISPTGSKKDVWESFPEHMHQIMHPLLSSRYTLAYPSQPKKAHPLFGSTYATTFLEWAHNWAGQLIPLIESESIRELLRTVHPSMRRDVRTLFLFLPYVLLHAVKSKNNSQYIQEEILAVIGLENFEMENAVTIERTRYKMLRHIRMTPSINTVQAEEGNQSKCSKTIYTLLDFLNRWLLEWCHSKQRPTENDNYKAISSFLDKFDKLTIARGNFVCGELERALQYIELYMDERKDKMQEQLPFLAEIYALLDEPDSVAGILSMKRSEPSLKELILAQVVTGRLQDAALCYERLAQEGQLDRHSLQGMIDCYLGLDQPFTAYRLLSEHDDEDDMKELSAEPLWRLGRFDDLDELCKKPVPPSNENWGLLMGRTLLAYRQQDHDAFLVSCKDTTSRLLAQMDGESKGENALRSGYQSVLGLHIITETSHAEEVLQRLKELRDGDRQSTEMVNQLLDEWRRRLSVVQSDVRTIEPLLRLRRILLQQTQQLLEPTHPLTATRLKACIGDLWLQSAKHARKAGIFQQAGIININYYIPVSPTPSSVSASPEHTTQASTELSRYLDRNYWEQRIARENTVAPTAPAPASQASDTTEEFPKPSTTKVQDDDAEDKEIDEFVETLKSQVEIFVNRMKSNSSRGRSIANDTAVQTLFMNITAMHSRLLRYIQQQDDKRVYLESLQDKVTQIRDSRAALDTLRAEHTARLAAAAEAAERQRQMQMAAKLQAMRKKKHEYLQYQRQLALQRVQEQEREMQMRQEQQKHQYLMNANNFYMPGVSMQQYGQAGYANQPIYANTQFHQQMMAAQAAQAQAQVTTDGNVPQPVPGQAQMSTANMPMNMNPMGIQSMPQLPTSYGAMSSSAGGINQTPVSVQPSMNQSNLRPNLAQQLTPLQQQMMLQQMHQMRMPAQGGMHQMVPQTIANGMPGQNIPQQNGQNPQLPKQNLPNQPQQQPAMMPQMSVAQSNIAQQNMNQQLMNTNPMLGLQMQNMRMPLMQGNQPNTSQQVPVSGYQNMSIPNQVNTQQPGSQAPNMQVQSQMQMPGQSMPMQGQQMMQGQTMPGQPQGMQMNNNMPQVGQNIPPQGQQVPLSQGQQMPLQQHLHQQQMPLNQQMPMPGQGMQQPGQQMMMQGQPIQHQGQNMMNQGQTPQGQMQPGQLPPGPQQMNQAQIPTSLPGQQMIQGQLQQPVNQMQMGHHMQMAPGQQMQQGPPMQGQMPQQMGMPQPQMQQQLQHGQPGQQIMPGQQKMQQASVPQGPSPPGTNQQAAQTPGKPEQNNNTGELISFD